MGFLREGGSLVLKAFTTYEHSSLGMLFLMGCCFDRLIVTKPATSKSANSETYWVGIGFRGLPDGYLEQLLRFSMDATLLTSSMHFHPTQERRNSSRFCQICIVSTMF